LIAAHRTDQERLQAIVLFAENGDLDSAAREAAAVLDRGLADEAWLILSRVNANSQRWGAALAALDKALEYHPDSLPVRLERALIMEMQGQERESLAELEALAGNFTDSPRLLVQLARALKLNGRADEAERRLESALQRWPIEGSVHSLLAQLRWQRGAGAESTALLERAIAEYPHELQLRLIGADVLRNAGLQHKALEWLEGGLARAPGSATFLTSVGVVLESLDRPEAALPYLLAAIERAPGAVQARRNLIPTLLRLGRAAEALSLADDLSAQFPDDQLLIAYRSTALRVMGDSRYARLHDYERLVRVYQPAAPPGFADMVSFNAALARELRQLHHTSQRPLAQSLRGGSQTERNLPAGNPLIAAFFALIDAPIRDYIAKLRDAEDHPTDRRKSRQYRLSGSWSVQLQPGGFHIDHVHPQGWLSSAYYVELPERGAEPASRAGWLKFGEPGVPLASCPPDHFVQPTAGMLVLFPSFMWHGTVPFEGGSRRLTAAFDVCPV